MDDPFPRHGDAEADGVAGAGIHGETQQSIGDLPGRAPQGNPLGSVGVLFGGAVRVVGKNLNGRGFPARGADGDPFLIPCSVQFSSVAQSCLTLCYPMDCSMPGFPVHHQLLELTQTQVIKLAMPSNHPKFYLVKIKIQNQEVTEMVKIYFS